MKRISYNLEKQHQKGKLHAIERIQGLLDQDTFQEIGMEMKNFKTALSMGEEIDYDGVITGYGMISGRRVFIYAQDFTVKGGTVGFNHGKKIAYIIAKAIENRCPVIGINDSGGARIQEGIHALAGYGEVFYQNTRASGYIPQISIIAGPCAGGAAYSPGLTDFVFVIEGISKMFVTGSKVIQQVTAQQCSDEVLGGAKVHSEISGVADFYCEDEQSCYQEVRKLIETLPEVGQSELYSKKYLDKDLSKITSIVPAQSRKAYDMKLVIEMLLDQNSFLEVQAQFAKNIVIGFGKLSGITVGMIANQPGYMGGVLDANASMKSARFIRYCDAYQVPLISLVDVPGFLPSIEQEHHGIIRHGAKLLYAYAEATVPKLTVILRKAYGGAYIAMSSKHLGADFTYAWPQAEIGIMGAESAVEILYNKELKALNPLKRKARAAALIAEYQSEHLKIEHALAEGYLDMRMEPEQMREILYYDLLMLQTKQSITKIAKKHGNIPL